MPYRVRRLRPEEVAEIAGWHYDGDHATYDPGDESVDPTRGYLAVEDPDGRFVGYCCFGEEARVPGVEADPAVLDVGVGLAPDLVGQGRGPAFAAAVLAYGRARFAPERFRAVVLTWNARSLAVCAAVGFERVGTHEHDGRTFTVVERPV